MRHFLATKFLTVFNDLHMALQAVPMTAWEESDRRPVDWQAVARQLAAKLGDLGEECKQLPLSRAFLLQIERVRGRIFLSSNDTQNNVTLTLVYEVLQNLRNELDAHRFYVVSDRHIWLTEEGAQLFGADVAAKFPDANRDISASGRCLALDEWTASVFHCMRALEHGLRALAVEVGVPMNGNLELENWKNVIDQIEKAVRGMESLPKSPLKVETLRFYSDAASQFRYFKDAWRNHVSHSRVTYDEHDATSVWVHTREFMGSLARPRP